MGIRLYPERHKVISPRNADLARRRGNELRSTLRDRQLHQQRTHVPREPTNEREDSQELCIFKIARLLKQQTIKGPLSRNIIR
jgi:hypothetical protein